MVKPWFIAVERFGPESEESWNNYIKWSGLTQLKEVISLDGILCPAIIKELSSDDWLHNAKEDNEFFFFQDLEYLLKRVANYSNINILAVIKNPCEDCKNLYEDEHFEFIGYDLRELHGNISALTNCGGFEKAFKNEELSKEGIIPSFRRVQDVQKLLREFYPEEHHANCDIWAIWKMKEP